MNCSKQSPKYIKYKLCEHSVCWTCYTDLNPLHQLCLSSMCYDCCVRDIDQNEANYVTECPTCYVTYDIQNNRSEHNCLDDDGVYDL